MQRSRMLVYQRDVRAWLKEESARARRPVTLGSLPAGQVEELADRGFHGLWLRGLWRPAAGAVAAARRSARTLEACLAVLPDLELEDIEGPDAAALELDVDARWGGRDGLAELRDELLRRDLRLIVDLPRIAGEGAGGSGAAACLEAAAGMADGVVVCRETLEGRAADWAAAIRRVRRPFPGLLCIAEAPARDAAAWLEHGFDRVLDPVAAAAWRALQGAPQAALARGLELDGDRAARRLETGEHEAAAVLAYLAPGLRVIADGELEGRALPRHPCLARRADEAPHRQLAAFHDRLLEVIAQIRPEERELQWLSPRPAWDGSPSWRQMVVYLLAAPEAARVLVAVNRGGEKAQCYVDLPGDATSAGSLVLEDLFSLASYQRPAEELARKGLYLELEGRDYNVFLLAPRPLHCQLLPGSAPDHADDDAA